MTIQYPDVNVPLVGEDGNAFAIIGRVSAALKRAGHREAASEFAERAFACDSYDELLRLTLSTVNTDGND